mmetsp:Transcript_15994/g.26226  ORF Transcript_15994/g.26226 Transcript_15994/m.26226 type:complete len:520 (-) Transcript_15994:3174-4733(-)|eukprot:CAMPEP_0184337338 /NCGR_PEP_ID=MMETSP1089-20130417/5726_1 /TAXON_ID=38269 ORGANISM="Gloeochaete wittrockiana, Strain SAG46.84" /NCGR_SAMPLE_ID=MMETSP1089 /ASSEMBLY_ACC=CAM_ASM_000445 /LENGTH=519 /DNA_ID=CAMNT_0026662989 /DNA_START=241 /DNA_END=1800 /DNA_ORIENTATION=-
MDRPAFTVASPLSLKGSAGLEVYQSSFPCKSFYGKQKLESSSKPLCTSRVSFSSSFCPSFNKSPSFHISRRFSARRLGVFCELGSDDEEIKVNSREPARNKSPFVREQDLELVPDEDESASSSPAPPEVSASSPDHFQAQMITLLSGYSVANDPAAQAFVAAKAYELGKSDARFLVSLGQTGIIIPLVSMLGSPYADVQWRAARLLSSMAGAAHTTGDERNRHMISKAGGIEAMFRLLKSPHEVVLMHAAKALYRVVDVHSNNYIHSQADVDALADLCNTEHTDSVQMYGAAVLWAISIDERNWGMIGKSGGVRRLIPLLFSINTSVQEYAARCLGALALQHENWSEINKRQGFKQIVHLLSSPCDKVKRAAASALFVPCQEFDQSSFGPAIRPLLSFLKSDDFRLRRAAAGSLWNLAVAGKHRTTISTEGGIMALVNLLSVKCNKSQEYAARTLAVFSSEEPELTWMLNLGAREKLMSLLASEDERVHFFAGKALWSMMGLNERAIERAIEWQDASRN